ncbi:MAG: hypothetical protein GKS05_06220 [Nitrospirales bacterium]|nr:hypothetical protein [Nitrospirales bacterium]
MSRTMLFQLGPVSFRKSLSLVCLGIFLVVIGLSPVWAAKAKSFKVGVVDPQAVIQGSKAGKRALATLQEHANVRKNLLKKDEEAIEKLTGVLEEANNLSEEKRKEKQDYYQKTYQDYQQKVQGFQKRTQQFKQELAEKQKEMVVEYMGKIRVATKAVAEKHGFSMVIDKGSPETLHIVLYNKKGLDITSEVVKEFDRRFK